MLKLVVKYRFLVVLIILFVLFLPQVFGGASAGDKDAIITALAVDKTEGQYEVSIQYLVPTAGEQYKQRFDVISDKAESMSASIAKLALKLGKNIGLSHCQEMIISGGIAEEDLMRVYDFCMRYRLDTNGLALIYTPDNAKEFLTAQTEKQNDVFLKLSDENEYSEKYLHGRQTTLAEFYQGYFSPAKTAVLALIEMQEEEQPPPTSGGEEEQGSGEKPKKNITNSGKTAIFKNGKLLIELDREQTAGFNWFCRDAEHGLISVPDVNGGQYKNALVGLEVLKKKNYFKVNFKNGMPVYDLYIEMMARVADVQQENLTMDNYNVLSESINKVLKEALTKHIKTQVTNAIEVAKENSFDHIDIYNSFYKFKNREFKKYLNSLNDENYMQGIKFNTHVIVKGLL